MKKIVITGGPCGGKSTVMAAIQSEFRGQVMLVPEVATVLLEGGFPNPGRDLDWSEAWQAAFQAAILPLQTSFEDAFALSAEAKGAQLLVCDRGLLDGAAYTPGGVMVFVEKYNLKLKEALSRYDAVVHLESLASADPSKYGKANNEARFEPLERAQELEHATRAAWEHHPHRPLIEGRRGIEGKVSEVIGIVRYLLAGPPI